MPKAPITDNVLAPGPMGQGPMPSETDFAMAAATMHAQGRLFQVAGDVVPFPKGQGTNSDTYNARTAADKTQSVLKGALGVGNNIIPLVDPRGK